MTAGRARWGLVALFAVAAVVATLPAVGGLRSEFMADGHPATARSPPATICRRPTASGSSAISSSAEQRPWVDPYSFQPLVEPQTVLGGWPFRLLFWPLDALFGPVVAWNLLLLAVTFAAGLFAYLWLRELDLPPAAAALGGLAFELAPYRLAPERRAPARLDRRAPPARALGLRALAPGSVRARCASLGCARGGGGRLDPALGQLHLPSACSRSSPPTRRSASRARRVLGLGEERWPPPSRGWSRRRSSSPARRSRKEEPRRGRLLLGEPARRPQPLAPPRARALRLPRLVLPVLAVVGLVVLARRRRRPGGAARPRRPPARAAGAGNEPAALRDAPRRLPAAALPAGAGPASCRWRTWRSRRWRRSRRRGQSRASGAAPHAVAAALLALVAADLLVFPLRGSEADPDNAAYAALADSGPGRVLELPIFQRGTGQFGSVYQYYTQQAPRERPTGYALAPEEVFAFTERFNRLDCGAWLPRRPGGAGRARHPLDPLARRALPTVGDAGQRGTRARAPARGARDRRRRPGGLPVGARAGRRAARP